MSLFKTEEFWSTNCGYGESYNFSTLCVGKFFLNSNDSDQIITGSMTGYLRMFSSFPKSNSNKQNIENDNPFSLVKSNSSIDITIEYYIKQPIIQLATGKFCHDSKMNIALLNPNRLVFLDIDEEQMVFRILEEFNLKRTAYNFCFGHFGQVSERDFVCIQSTDTTLLFYVNGHLSFCCYLSDYLVPGPIEYLSYDDSILIVNSNRYLEAYKYKNIAIVNSKNTELSGASTQKCTVSDWNYNLGDDALEIKICDSGDQDSLILILCRYSTFIFSAKNRTCLKKLFECRCKLITCYGTGADFGPRYLLLSNANQLMVMESTLVKWQASLIYPDIIDLKVGRFNGLMGFIVTLSESGHLSIMYLGTDPSINQVLTHSVRELIIDSNDDELVALQKRIQSMTASDASSSSGQDIISVKSSESSSKSLALKINIDFSSGKMVPLSDALPKYSIDVRLKSVVEIKNVVLRIAAQPPIDAHQKLFHYPCLVTNGDVKCQLSFGASSAMVAHDLRVQLYATYHQMSDSVVKIGQAVFTLPLSLVVTNCSPCKQAKFKVTIDSTEDVANLSKLFPDFQTKQSVLAGDHSDVAIGFQYHNEGPVVTILASATTKRYRIQSDHFEAIWLILRELTNRLTNHLGSSAFQVKFSDPVPLDSYYLIVDFHFSVRTNLAEFHRLLDEKSKQYRAIQKLFLTKTQDKSLPSIQNLDSLLENSVSQILELSELIIEQEQQLKVVGNALCAATSLISYLLQITTAAPQNNHHQQQLLQTAFSGSFRDFPDMGLEELYEQIFAFLLQSVGLGNRNKDVKLTIVKPEMPTNISRLKKLVGMLSDHVGQGVRLNVGQEMDKPEFTDNLENVKKFVTSPHSKSKKSKKSKHKEKKIVSTDLA